MDLQLAFLQILRLTRSTRSLSNCSHLLVMIKVTSSLCTKGIQNREPHTDYRRFQWTNIAPLSYPKPCLKNC
ncbi:hypothetical protein GQ457_05G007500 [Hibiscus cannabinus]